MVGPRTSSGGRKKISEGRMPFPPRHAAEGDENSTPVVAVPIFSTAAWGAVAAAAVLPATEPGGPPR